MKEYRIMDDVIEASCTEEKEKEQKNFLRLFIIEIFLLGFLATFILFVVRLIL